VHSWMRPSRACPLVDLFAFFFVFFFYAVYLYEVC
jgi:hypothetical protein